MSFVAIALSSALMLSTPLLVAERSELLADHASAEPVVSPAAVAAVRTSSPRVSAAATVPHDHGASRVPSPDNAKADLDEDFALSKRTDSAVSVSSMAPLTISTALPSIDTHRGAACKSPLMEDADEALGMTDEQCDDLLTSPDAPLSFKAARQLLFPEPSLVALPFPTTLMDFAMDAPAVKHALPVVEDDLDTNNASSSQEKEEWVVQSHAGAISAHPCHVGIGFPFGI